MTTATRESIGRQARTPRLLAPFVRGETYRAVLFYLAELVLGTAGFALLVAGWAITLCFSITPLVVPLLIGLLFGVAMLAHAEAGLARNLLGAPVHPARPATSGGFWQRGFRVLRDRAFWKQQAHLLLAWPIALIPLALLSTALQLVSLPLWYRWADSSDVLGLFDVDTFVESLPVAAVGLAGLVLIAHLLGPWATLSRRLAVRLLSGDGVARSAAQLRVFRLRALTVAALTSTAVAIVLVAIWALTTQGYFWPVWPLISLAFVVGVPGWVVLVLEHPLPRRLAGGSTWLAIQVGVSVLITAFLVAVWAASTQGYFWPIWPALCLAVLGVVTAAVVFARHQHRIEALETSRAGAVDAQETELRRIERDLHDGAQARLVALGMSLGMAEQHVDTDPEAVRELIAEARLGAAEALAELRDLARGIHPPILTDRGLEAAVRALVVHSPIPVSLAVDVPERPSAAIETAAYFTVSEALANAIKHGDATRVDIRIETVDGRLRADVTDDGRGEADPAGRGLTGIRRRLEALDGTLLVSSPPGGPTTVHAELPCES
jgi:signal transduction histidine kinase